MTSPAAVVGVDFDNTLVSYDGLLQRLALERGLISPATRPDKKSIRDEVRRLPGGEIEWQKLQAVAYGSGIDGAVLMPGAEKFCAAAGRRGVPLYIVSHKTEFAGYDEARVNLRHAALGWMRRHRFFEADGLGFSLDRVHFVSSRAEKLSLIGSLQCRCFIDDLEETFAEPDFPAGVEKILYAPRRPAHAPKGVTVQSDWREISDYVLGPGA